MVQGRGGGVDGTPPLDFCCVSTFWRDFAFGRKPSTALQDEVYIMGWGAAGGLWHHLRWRPYCPVSWILPKIKNYEKRRKLEIVNASHVKYDIMKHFADFCVQFVLFPPKKGKKTQFYPKWLDHLLLMTSYLVTVATNSHQTCVKMCLRNMPTATENGRC